MHAILHFLAAAVPSEFIKTGHRATAFEQNGDTARVTFANGSVVEADVVVGADGIHSELRPYVFLPSKPVFHGTICYRGLVPRERLPHWPMDRWQMWAGPSKHFLVFPVRHGEIVNYVGFVPADEEMKESWSAPGNPDVLRAEFEGWDPRTSLLVMIHASAIGTLQYGSLFKSNAAGFGVFRSGGKPSSVA